MRSYDIDFHVVDESRGLHVEVSATSRVVLEQMKTGTRREKQGVVVKMETVMRGRKFNKY
jgi:hypothetical protein